MRVADAVVVRGFLEFLRALHRAQPGEIEDLESDFNTLVTDERIVLVDLHTLGGVPLRPSRRWQNTEVAGTQRIGDLHERRRRPAEHGELAPSGGVMPAPKVRAHRVAEAVRRQVREQLYILAAEDLERAFVA